jgi:hypothetical protein
LIQKYKGKLEINVCSQFFACIGVERGILHFEDWSKNHFFGRYFFSGGYLGMIANGDFRLCGFRMVIDWKTLQSKATKGRKSYQT